MTQNYEYEVGGSLKENAPSYVVRQADTDLYNNLKAGVFCYIFNSRQMGKTSLIVRTMKKLQAEGYACTSLDFSVRGSRDVKLEQWYAGIVYKLVVNFNIGNPSEYLRNWWQERGAITPVERLEEFIETELLTSIQSKIIIFIDEIDSILSLSFSTDDFFALIRSCYQKRTLNPEYERLTFALVGVATPGDLIGDKRRTPFNIGKAIQLDGFKESEIEPLAKGFSGQVENPLALMQEVLTWTGGQPFLTQKVCKLLTDDKIGNGQTLESIIKSKIIENWEARDEPEHLKTIRDRLLLGEQIAGRFLGWYQQILNSGYIYADGSVEQMRFRLTGLVVKHEDKVEVYNKVYKCVFNLNWVEKELDKLRPYSESFQAWVDSNFLDESRLLRGQALENALQWANNKSLSYEDSKYLAASQELEKTKLEVNLEIKEEERRLLAAANETLSQAQQKSKQLIRFGTGFLVVSITGAIIASLLANNAQKQLISTSEELAAVQLERTGIKLQKSFILGEIKNLSDAIRTGRKLQNLARVKNKQSLGNYPAYSPIISLQDILLNIRERNQLQGHQKPVVSVAFSTDGKMIASASEDKTIKLWDVSTGKEIRTLKGHKNTVWSVAFSTDGKMIASGSADKTIKLWDISTGQLISSLNGDNNTVFSVAFSPDGKTLASAGADKTIKLWNISTSQIISTLNEHRAEVVSIAFSPDGKTLASASNDQSIKLWDVLARKEIYTLTGHKGIVWSVAFSKDGKTLASASKDKTIKLWNVPTGKEIGTLTGHQNYVTSVAFNVDGKTLASASYDNTIKLWNYNTYQEISTLVGHQGWVNSVAFSADGKTLASVSRDKTIKLWNTNNSQNNSQKISTLTGYQSPVWSVAFSADSKTLASASEDKNIKLWDISTGKETFTLTGHKDAVRSIAFSRDGKTLASASNDENIKLWNTTTGKLIYTLYGHNAEVVSVAFSRDGKTLASASWDKTIKLWNTTTGQEIDTLYGHDAQVVSVAFSRDGKTLASASQDKTVKLWDISTGKEISTLTDNENVVTRSVAFSGNGKTLASAGEDRTIKLWDISTHKKINTLRGHEDIVTSITFSADDKTLASASQDKTVKLWDISTGKEISTLIGHSDVVTSVAFSEDGKTLASASWDKTIKLWNFDLDNLLAQGCSYLKDYFVTREQERNELCPGLF